MTTRALSKSALVGIVPPNSPTAMCSYSKGSFAIVCGRHYRGGPFHGRSVRGPPKDGHYVRLRRPARDVLEKRVVGDRRDAHAIERALPDDVVDLRPQRDIRRLIGNGALHFAKQAA